MPKALSFSDKSRKNDTFQELAQASTRFWSIVHELTRLCLWPRLTQFPAAMNCLRSIPFLQEVLRVRCTVQLNLTFAKGNSVLPHEYCFFVVIKERPICTIFMMPNG